MENLILTCIQCNTDFEFGAGEQQKYQERGFDVPLRCPQCRKNKYRDSEHQERRKFKDKKKHHRFKFDEQIDY
ncbi:MAG: zinc-ribbon domain containing protein [Pseudomonadota bacterium]